jgi:site-specific recombinase XerD
MRDALDDYLLECSIKLSPQTMRWYREKLGVFVTALEDQPITPARVNSFLRRLQTTPSTRTGQPLSSYTLHGYAQVVKSFVNWCAANNYLEKAPRIQMPRVDEKVIEVFSEGQIKQMLAVTAQEETPTLAHRDRALLLFLLDTGVRASELCGLTQERLHLAEGYALVIGKGRKEREVAFGQQTRVQLTRYLRRYRRGECAEVFTGKRGHPLTVSGVDQVLYRLEEWAGITGVRVSAHTFRHTFAVNFLLRGGDLYALSRLMGHTSVKTTEIYLRATKARQARAASVSLVDDLLAP